MSWKLESARHALARKSIKTKKKKQKEKELKAQLAGKKPEAKSGDKLVSDANCIYCGKDISGYLQPSNFCWLCAYGGWKTRQKKDAVK